MKTTRLVESSRARTGKSFVPSALLFVSAGLVLVPLAYSIAGGGDDPLEGLAPANEGAFEGGSTGTHEDAAEETLIPESELESGGSFDIPTGGKPSPLFGATSFSQKLLLFEEFGVQPMPASYSGGVPFPQPQGFQRGPEGTQLDRFLAAPLTPEPTRLANDRDRNPWEGPIESFLGRQLDTPPAEGRPAGEGWAHQRWQEFPPQVWFKTSVTNARANGGVRDAFQRHRYALGEFAPGGLYHNTAGMATTNGTTRGIEIRLHPRMPVQGPNSVWTFDGTLPPKLLIGRLGETVLMRNYNGLPIDPAANRGFGLHTISTHEHNGHNPAESDGFANAFFFPGQYYDYRWPLCVAGFDWINSRAEDRRCGSPDGLGGIRNVAGDYREVMSTHWFHDHMLDFTAQNVYKGNAAMFNIYSAVDRGNEAIDDGVNLRLPSGTSLDWGNRDYDVNLVIGDKAWLPDGQLWFNIFNTDGFMGDRVTVNWQYHPYLDVRARKYRFRILNGAVSRYMKLALVDQAGRPVAFHLIANDGNIMEHAVAFDGTLGTQAGVLPVQGIAERYDIVVDFSRFRPGDRLYFVNLLEHNDGKGPNRVVPLADVLSGRYRPVARDKDGDGQPDRWENGDPGVGKFMEFRVHAYSGVDRSMDPREYIAGKKKMLPLPDRDPAELATAIHRTFEFGRSGGGSDSAPWTIKTDGGSGFSADPRRISAAIDVGDTTRTGRLEIWHIKNGGNGWSHPVHVHFEEGTLLSRDGQAPPEWEKWARKDMYRVGGVESGADVEIAIRVRDFAGTYVEHCHNTQHEDHAMLLRWDALRPGQLALMPAPIPTWDGVEFVNSVALPTVFTGDGVGPVTLDGLGGDDEEPSPVETIAATLVQYSPANGWRIQGTDVNTPAGTTVRVRARLGSSTGTIIGSAQVQSDTTFLIRVSSGPVPVSSSTVRLESNTGAVLEGVPVQIVP
jgi:FtsP/CotA-like multicopper oxidase with cupredoxin domain